MTDPDTMREWPIGTKVRANEHHRVQFPRSGVRRGKVIGYPSWGRGVRVKWDERKTPDALHVDYLTTRLS